jgi:hypothetical protein
MEQHMKTMLSVIVLTGLIASLSGCSTHSSPATQAGATTTVKGLGTPGAVVMGYYARHGERVAFTNSLPFSFTQTGITMFEVRKARRETELTLTARRGVVEVGTTAAPGVPGLRVILEDGLEIQTLWQ